MIEASTPDPDLPPRLNEALSELVKCAMPLGVKQDIALYPWEEDPEKVERGTFSLVQTQGNQFFVTCDHVVKSWQVMKQAHPFAEIVAIPMSLPFLEDFYDLHLVDSDERLDVAVFKTSSKRINLPGVRFVDYEASLQVTPHPGEIVIVLGYPRANFDVKGRVARFGIAQLFLAASSVLDDKILLVHEAGTKRTFTEFSENPRSDIALGGLSGSPAFVYRKDHGFHFVGILTGSWEGGKIIYISRLRCLNPDGTLDRLAMPPREPGLTIGEESEPSEN